MARSRFASMLNPSVNRRRLAPRAKCSLFFVPFDLLLPFVALRLPAQSLSGKFTGTVFDPSAAPVPNATVIMTNHKTSIVEMTTSDAQGNFKLRGFTCWRV